MREEIWYNLLFFLIVFLIVFLVTYGMNYNRFKKKKVKKIGEYHYLQMKFHCNFSSEEIRKMLLSFSLIDALIISFVTTFILLIPLDFIWQMLIGFVLLFALIYACYEIYGRHLVRKNEKIGRK